MMKANKLSIGQLYPDFTEKDGFPDSFKDIPMPNRNIWKSQYDSGMRSMMHSFCTTKLSKDQLMQGKIWQPFENVTAYCLPMHEFERLMNIPIPYPIGRDGYIETHFGSIGRKLRGNILSIFVQSRAEEFPMESSQLLELTIAKYRMMAGSGAIVDVVTKSHYNPKTGGSNSMRELPRLPFWYYEGPDIDDSWDPKEKSFKLSKFTITPEASRLYSLSMKQEDPSTQFLLLWLALECQTEIGPRMKQHFQKMKVGSVILKELERLKQLRSDFAHFGKAITRAGDLESLSLLFRLGCIDEHSEIEFARDHFEDCINESVFS